MSDDRCVAPRPTEVRVLHTEVEVRGDTVRTISGIAAPYGETTDIGPFTEEFKPGVFKRSTQNSTRATAQWNELRKIPLLVSHDHAKLPIGIADRWEETPGGLVGHWRMASTKEANDVRSLVDDGILTQLSVGFQPVDSDWDQQREKPHVVRREARLLEVSLVSVSAYDGARVIAVRSAGVPGRSNTAVDHRPHLAHWRKRIEAMRTGAR